MVEGVAQLAGTPVVVAPEVVVVLGEDVVEAGAGVVNVVGVAVVVVVVVAPDAGGRHWLAISWIRDQ